MKTNTKYFGEIEYDAEEILTLPRGLFGFEEEHEFLLLPFEGGDQAMFSLQSLATPLLAFVLMDPFVLNPEYAPILQKEELAALDVDKSEDLYYYVTCVVKEPVADSTVNLRCPIAINGDSRVAMQVILEDAEYEMRHRLAEFVGEEDPPC